MPNKSDAAEVMSAALLEQAGDLGALAHSLIYGTEGESRDALIACAVLWGKDAVTAFIRELTGGAVG